MRGSESFDGKIAGNRQMVDRYNESKGKKKGIKAPLKGGPGTQPEALPKAGGGSSGGAREPGGHDEMKDIRGEHGQAVSHHIFKTHQGYHSITGHEDGFTHPADHESLEEAHEHGKSAMGDEDTSHLGDMPEDDYQVAEQDESVDENPSRATRRVGYMS